MSIPEFMGFVKVLTLEWCYDGMLPKRSKEASPNEVEEVGRHVPRQAKPTEEQSEMKIILGEVFGHQAGEASRR